MIKVSPKFKRNLSRVIPFGIIWLVIGVVFLSVEMAVTQDQEAVLDSAIKMDLKIFIFATLGITVIGLLVGVIELLFINRLFIKRSFRAKIFYKFMFYSFGFSIVVFVMFMMAASIELQMPVTSPEVWDKYVTFFFSVTHLSTILQLGFSLLVSLIYAEVSENLGQNVLYNFFTGSYHKPKIEQRIFMFSDMKSSTAIAEQIGHISYFELLRCYYNDLSDAIINHYGEVYQYIGDEVVLSWTLKRERVAEASIACFYAMKADLLKKKGWYLKTFGVFPDFKAAIHLGEVTTGEIGALKKEIFFTGDVLNTTARIQGLCNSFETDILVSQNLLDALKDPSTYTIKKLGDTTLKGKTESIKLYSITMEHS